MAVTQNRQSTTLFGPVFNGFIAPSRLAALARAPEADVMEDEHAIRVMVEVPGFRPEDLAIELEGNVLTIAGEKREERTEGGEKSRWHLSERRFGRFTRSFILPRDVEQEQIGARCENGVLEVTIPKSERTRRRRVEILGAGESSQPRQLDSQGSDSK